MAEKASIISKPVGFVKTSWAGGMGTGALNGAVQGSFRALGMHQFFARGLGSLASASLLKGDKYAVDRKIILNQGLNEALFELIGGD